LTFRDWSASLGYMEQKTVLVIENSYELQDVYEAIFSHEKYAVSIADSYTEALEKLKEDKWDIVVLDMLYRGGINGLALLERYKSDPVYQSITKQPIFLAIVDDEDQAEKARLLAHEIFIMGTFTPGEVLKKAQECLQKRREDHPVSPAA
jgi:CheY-like chemotaxis protein